MNSIGCSFLYTHSNWVTQSFKSEKGEGARVVNLADSGTCTSEYTGDYLWNVGNCLGMVGNECRHNQVSIQKLEDPSSSFPSLKTWGSKALSLVKKISDLQCFWIFWTYHSCCKMGDPTLRCSIDDTLCTWVVHSEHRAHKLFHPLWCLKRRSLRLGEGPSTSSVCLSMKKLQTCHNSSEMSN
jgi:hypothetical protein